MSDGNADTIAESTTNGNEQMLAALRESHGHLPKEEFFLLAMSMNIALPPDEDPPSNNPFPQIPAPIAPSSPQE